MKKNEMICPMEVTLKAIGGRWKVLILNPLFKDGVKRFGELHRSINGISQKMLTQELRSLERNGIINRKVYPQVPPKVEYSLTSLGESLKPIFDLMNVWGIKRLNVTKDLVEN